jgi:hypothetical protein
MSKYGIMDLINRDDHAAGRRSIDISNVRREAHEEWSSNAKNKRHVRRYFAYSFACIWDEIKKKVDDAQNGDFGPLFVAVGLVGAFVTLVIIIIVGGRDAKEK